MKTSTLSAQHGITLIEACIVLAVTAIVVGSA